MLSGGGARGFAHIGVMQALQARDVRVDAIAGTSMGAILGAMAAAGHDADAIYDIADGLGWRDVLDLSFGAGLLKGDKLKRFLQERIPATFDALDVPLAITTTDMETGEEVILREGDLVEAVRASSSFPGAFEPVVVGECVEHWQHRRLGFATPGRRDDERVLAGGDGRDGAALGRGRSRAVCRLR